MHASSSHASLATVDSTAKNYLTPADFERELNVPPSTQAVWRSTNRYGFADLVTKVGRSIRYRRADVEKWLESRRATALADQ